MKQFITRTVEMFDTLGFALIVGSVVYFILGSVAGLVGGRMLDWTFCGSAHYLLGVEWCGITGDTDEAPINHFIHRLMNVTLPWFGIFWGFVLVGVCAVLLKLLDYQYVPPGSKNKGT
jgi:hypothetical protein